MADAIVEVQLDATDVRGLVANKVIEAHNDVVSRVIEFKEQGDIDDKQDEILANAEAVRPDAETTQAVKAGEAEYSLENLKYLADYFKQQLDATVENLQAKAYEAAKAGINAEYDIDKGRLEISEARKSWARDYAAALDMFKLAGSISEERITDEESGKTSVELVANDKFGEVLLKVSSAPSIRAKRGTGQTSTGTSEGAKIRAWGRENGFPDINDRGPLPQELKDKYAEAHAS